MAKTLSTSDENHLRRLVAWVDCEAGQEPDAMVATVRGICERLGDVSDEGKARLVESHAQSCNTPQYIRAALKALRKLLALDHGSAKPDEALRLAVERTRDDLGATGDNYPAVRKLLSFSEAAIAAEDGVVTPNVVINRLRSSPVE